MLNALLQCVGIFGIIGYKKQAPFMQQEEATNTEISDDSREERMRKRFESRER
jgi:hypothetical protein